MDGDDGFDPCECAWGHELAMRRLLSLLRQSQSHCTDTECYIDGNQDGQSESASHYLIVMSIVLALYFFMHFWMTSNRRNGNSIDISKPSKGNGAGGAPPTPPPSMS